MFRMKRQLTIALTAVLLVIAGAAISQAQRFARYHQNEPPATEFIFARLHYGTGGLGRFQGWGSDGWAHDYPTAEEHINQIMSEATGINVEAMSYRIVEIGSPEIFKYPFTYISEAGEMWLTEEEVVNFREYLNRGGFVMVDDFDNARSLETLRQNLLRLFPDREMFPLSHDHQLFHTFYDTNWLDVDSPYNYGEAPAFYGYPDGKGGTSMIICHNNDLGDFWEWIDQPRLALRPSTESLRLGINFILYAMTH
jgi:hypothetical protein